MLVVAVVLVVVAGDLVVLVEACTHGEVVPDRVFKPLCALRLHKGEPSPDKGVDLCGAQGAFLARVQRQRNQALERTHAGYKATKEGRGGAVQMTKNERVLRKTRQDRDQDKTRQTQHTTA